MITVLDVNTVPRGFVTVIRYLLTPRIWYSNQMEDTVEHITRKTKVV
jgi:hypothetical protein